GRRQRAPGDAPRGETRRARADGRRFRRAPDARQEEGNGRPRQEGPRMTPNSSMPERAEQFRQAYRRVREEIGKVIVGHNEIVDGVLTCLFVGGHALLEGVPGLGKTLLVRTLSQVLDLKFNRIQFTPDLMPADIIGTTIITESAEGKRAFAFQS